MKIMNRFFTILFAALAAICLMASLTGRPDYLIIATMCGVAAWAGRVEEKKDKARGYE